MAIIDWNGPVSGDWSVATDWSSGTVPGPGDAVVINFLAPYTVTVSGADFANSLAVNGDLATLRENSGSLTIAGALRVDAGLASLNMANSIGSVSLAAGAELAVGNAGALGTAAVTQTGGELLATASETLTNALLLSGNSTIAAAHGTTLNEKASDYHVSGGSTLNFGAPGQDGTVVWAAAGGSVTSPSPVVNVQAGMLKGANDALSFLLGGAPVMVAAGATLDLVGNSPGVTDLTGGGSVIDSGAAATLTLDAANLSGTISGALKLAFQGNAALSGLEDTTGGATLNGAIMVTNAGTYDIVANTNITGSAGSSFVNNKIFEKTGGGVSDVTSNFVNNGTLNVLSGSVQFTGGFTNHGVIHGRVTQFDGVTTVSAPVPSDFDGDGMSDILSQNVSGQAAVSEMNGNTPTGGGAISSNPGPSWKAIATGDFNGDGHSDILWQNVDGQASIWEMDGNTRIGGGAVSSNPGPSWTAVGSGDFNGDGRSDVLWQNADGQASIWEMDGSTRIGGGAVTPNPGPSWKAVGTGDFYGDGDSDVLWQNASGQASIWEMDGDTRVSGGAVSANPGPAWKAIGTGDFNDDGHSDILFQNTGTGQASIWEMNGNTRIGGGALSVNPGLSLHAIGTGDFNGDGHSDILFQNTSSGQVSIWEMNGNTLIGSGAVSPNLGSSWRAVGS